MTRIDPGHGNLATRTLAPRPASPRAEGLNALALGRQHRKPAS